MKLKSSFVAALIGRTSGPQLALSRDHLLLRDGPSTVTIPLTSVQDFSVRREVVWTNVVLQLADATWLVAGVSGSSAKRFQEQITRKIVSDGMDALKAADTTALVDEIERFLARDRYIAQSDVFVWIQTLASAHASVSLAMDLLRRPIFSKNMSVADMPADFLRLRDLVAWPSEELRIRNDGFVDHELVRLKSFFESFEARPLTEEQARAAIVGEDRNLVIASAGSGKTSVVTAKIGYSTTTGECLPSEVLALAFNRAASDELKARILHRLESGPPEAAEIQALTFHKLGLQIIAHAEGIKPSLAPWVAETGDNSGAIIQELAVNLAMHNPAFAERWMRFRVLASQPDVPIARFGSREDYDRYLDEIGECHGGQRGIRTLNGELVKSMEEVTIANWLYLNGIAYEYERSYEYLTANREHRQYHPDFYYPDIDVYHEHFALDEMGRTPVAFSQKYAEGVRWKRALHKEKKTNLFETTSAQFRDGTVLAVLEEDLRARGQVFMPRDPRDVEVRLSELRIPKFEALFRTFITLAKASGFGPAALKGRVSAQKDRLRAELFLDVVIPLFEAYEAHLKALKCIDFEDMIWKAVSYIHGGRYPHPFKLILVDEFQDISRSRSELIKAMLQQMPGSKLFAVGDDWQSIYRFAGADQSLMTHFEDEYGPTATSFLTTTFRCNQGISDTASGFIQRNPSQISKRVSSADDRIVSTVHVLEYARDNDVDALLAAELRTLAFKAPSRTRKARVLILGRFNHLRPRGILDWKKEFGGSVDLDFLTLHRAKGLEADYVFILGCNAGMYGLPCTIEDDPLLGMVLPGVDPFAHAEERRLFYVGLTRSRHRCYILTQSGAPSPFVRELVGSGEAVVYRVGCSRQGAVRAVPCPNCDSGVLREVFYEGQSQNQCSRSPQCGRPVESFWY